MQNREPTYTAALPPGSPCGALWPRRGTEPARGFLPYGTELPSWALTLSFHAFRANLDNFSSYPISERQSGCFLFFFFFNLPTGTSHVSTTYFSCHGFPESHANERVLCLPCRLHFPGPAFVGRAPEGRNSTMPAQGLAPCVNGGRVPAGDAPLGSLPTSRAFPLVIHPPQRHRPGRCYAPRRAPANGDL